MGTSNQHSFTTNQGDMNIYKDGGGDTLYQPMIILAKKRIRARVTIGGQRVLLQNSLRIKKKLIFFKKIIV